MLDLVLLLLDLVFQVCPVRYPSRVQKFFLLGLINLLGGHFVKWFNRFESST